QAEAQAEEKAGHGADFARDQFLRVNENGGEGGRENHPDDRAQNGAPEKIGVGQREGEGRDAEDRDPDDSFAADAVADWSAEKGAGRNRGEENEEMDLRVPDREAEFLDEEKRVVAAHAREIEILGEDEHDQDA